MRETKRFAAIAMTSVLALVLMSTPMSAGDQEAKWTFMVYLDADNSLETWGLDNLEWLESVGSDENVNFVVLMDLYTDVADLLYVEKGDSVSVGQALGYPKEVNMADPAILEEFIEVSVDNYPAENYILVTWDHGGGWRGMCWDDTTYEETGVDDCITMVELREALAGAYEHTGEVMDVLAFDMCLMAMPEVAYQARDYADYLVFSEEVVPAAGFPYDAIAEELVACPDMDGKELSKVICRDYATLYTSMNGFVDWTISAFDMAYMDELKMTVDQLGSALHEFLPVYVNAYQNDLITAQEYYYPYNIDLKGFALNLLADQTIHEDAVRDAAALVVSAVSDGVFIYINSQHNEDSTGISIYLPSTMDGMHSIKDSYADIPFATETSWYDFVLAFSSFSGRTWVAEKSS